MVHVLAPQGHIHWDCLTPALTKPTSKQWRLSALTKGHQKYPATYRFSEHTLLPQEWVRTQAQNSGLTSLSTANSISWKITDGYCCYLLTPTTFCSKFPREQQRVLHYKLWLKSFLSSLVIVSQLRALNAAKHVPYHWGTSPAHLSTGTNHESLKLTLKAAFDIQKQYPDSPQDGTAPNNGELDINLQISELFPKEQVHFIRVAGPGPDTS